MRFKAKHIVLALSLGLAVLAPAVAAGPLLDRIEQQAKGAGVISQDHDPLESADKSFVLKVLRKATSPLRDPAKEGIPPAEGMLPRIKSEVWVKLFDDPNLLLEGPAFDRQGNLYVTEVFTGKVYKITPDKSVQLIYDSKGKGLLSCLTIHKDGRLFLCDLMNGRVFAMNPDGTGITDILTSAQVSPPALVDDLVFDSKGNFYISDLSGNALNPTGRIIRVSADFKKVDVVAKGLAGANGIALMPGDGPPKLVVSEVFGNRLLTIELLKDGITQHPFFGGDVLYTFSGHHGPDSTTVDADGNIYQAMYTHGRILVLNKRGFARANVLVPGGAKGFYLNTTHVAFKPGTNEGFITAAGQGGGVILKFKGLGMGQQPYSHQD